MLYDMLWAAENAFWKPPNFWLKKKTTKGFALQYDFVHILIGVVSVTHYIKKGYVDILLHGLLLLSISSLS